MKGGKGEEGNLPHVRFKALAALLQWSPFYTTDANTRRDQTTH